MDIEKFLSKLDRVRPSNKGYSARCPAHQDKNNSLSVGEGKDGRILIKCFTGCATKAIVSALGLDAKDLFVGVCRPSRRSRCETVKRPRKSAKTNVSQPEAPSVKPGEDCEALTLSDLAAAKKFPESFLVSLGLRDIKLGGRNAVAIPYLGEDGAETATRYRLALKGDARFRWRSGAKVSLYGLQRLPNIHRAGWALIVEGESDCWTLWYHGQPCIGAPGKTNWKKPWAAHFKGVEAFIWQEPDAADFSQRIGKDIPDARVIVAPDGVKDISEAHLAGKDVAALIEDLKRTAIPIADLLREQQHDDLKELIEAAAPVLAAADPLDLIRSELSRLGYGGDLKPALISYLAFTTRLLKMRMGTMPAHLLLIGPPSIGKSFTVQMTLQLFPLEAVHMIDAGSSRVLIYDTADLQHRAVLFSESDSLPAGEDNPAASAVRNLLQDHRLHYQVVVRDPESGEPAVHEISKPGPTVLITTSTRFLGGQLGSRVFTLDVPNDADRLRDALKAQAKLEITPPAEPDTSLIAFQAVLQRLAPIDVMVPFAPKLADAIARAVNAPRILRDFQRLLSLIKAVTILRHRHREHADSRLLATAEDYAAVYDLVSDMYEAEITRANEQVRKVIEAVGKLETAGTQPITFTAVSHLLKLHPEQVKRESRRAIRQGWLINKEERKNRPANLTLTDAEPLPDRDGLPKPESLTGAFHSFTGLPEETTPHTDADAENDGVDPFSPNDGDGFDPDCQFPDESVAEFWARKKAEQ